ncbi:MAG: adenine phosphoribosyltransferase [Myxococcota bacterium]
MDTRALTRRIRNIPDFPKPGIQFRDITPLLLDAEAFGASIEAMIEPFRERGVDGVLAIESRGFLFGAPIAQALGVGLGLVRKKGKLPYDTHESSYELEYGVDSVEMHVDAVHAGQHVLIVDDVIATGGTAAAAVDLVRKAGAEVVGATFLIELTALGGRSRLDSRCHAVLRY